MGLLDLGVRGAVTRYVARYHVTGQDEDSSRIASTALMVFSIIGLVVLLVSVVLAVFVIGHLKIPMGLVGTARVGTVVSGLAIATTIISGAFGGVVTALQRFDLSSGSQVGIGAVRAIAVVIVLSSGGGLVPLAMIQLGQALLLAAVYYGLARRLYPELRA